MTETDPGILKYVDSMKTMYEEKLRRLESDVSRLEEENADLRRKYGFLQRIYDAYQAAKHGGA